DHQRIGRRTFGGQLGDFAEHDCEHHHREKGPHQRPSQADDGLLIADRDVAPGQNVEEFAVTPQISPVVALSQPRLYDEDVGLIHEFSVWIIDRHRNLVSRILGAVSGRPLSASAYSWEARYYLAEKVR